MDAIASDALVAAWERGRALGPLDRALVLYGLARPGCNRDALADRPLGERNAALLRLRQTLFGDRLDACVDCPRCGERLELAVRASALVGDADAIRPTGIEVDGVRFRLPTTRDLERAASGRDAPAASRALLLALVDQGSRPDEQAIATLVDRVAHELDRIDPCLEIALACTCPACAHAWTSALDVGVFLWDEIDARARDLLDAVHVLASAYGWREADVLAMSDARRMAYVDRVLG